MQGELYKSSDDAFLQVFGNSCCHGNTFSVLFSNCDFVGTCQHFLMFLGFKNLFVGSLHSKPHGNTSSFS